MARSVLERENDMAARNRQTNSLAGLAVMLVILVAALFLYRHLRQTAQIEDCMMAGRRDCVPVDAHE